MNTSFTTLRFSLRPVTAFGTPLLGETLFGQLCWSVLHVFGEERLRALLDGYAAGRPFVVLSDVFPRGHFPLPALPDNLWQQRDDLDRKYLKKKAWLPEAALSSPPAGWRELARTNAELLQEQAADGRTDACSVTGTVVHNTIDRITGTTGSNEFAPYVRRQTWLNPHIVLSMHAVLDETRLTRNELFECLRWIGLCGYGRDASTGLGKFKLEEGIEEVSLRTPGTSGRTVVTLASSVLSGTPGIVAEKCLYRTRTHFGRHGDALALTGTPFKRPVLLAQAAAVVNLEAPLADDFIGRGITGVSPAHPETVHQGYAPVVTIPDIP